MRRSSTLLATVTLLFGILLLGGCLEPFPAEPTTPTAKRGAASKPTAPAAGKPGDKPKEQSYQQAWQLICNAERLSGADRRDERDVRSSAVAEWINTHVKNNKARYWWIGYAKVKQTEREAYFRDEAKSAGQARCPLAALLFAPATRPATRPATPSPTPSATQPARQPATQQSSAPATKRRP